MDFVREAGFGIWLVFAFGGLSLAAAARYAAAPRREHLPVIVGFAVATLLAGALGTVTGIQLSARHVGELAAGERWIFLIGLAESLHALVVALVIACADALLATVGAHRLARADAGAAPVVA
jgi:hypothetical protein